MCQTFISQIKVVILQFEILDIDEGAAVPSFSSLNNDR